MSAELSVEHLPNVFSGPPGAPFVEQALDFEPLVSEGRIGAEIHRLYSTRETGPNGPAAAVVRYLPGAAAQPHRHTGYELIYLLSGELEIGDQTYGPNSLLVMPPNSAHAPRSPRGCLALAVWEQPVQPL